VPGEKRPDGFHAIESIFVPVSCFDRIGFQFSPHSRFSVTIDGMNDVPLEKNLMYRSARLFHEESGVPFSLRLTIEKHIPHGAGLGGGSSNAAAVLNALNEAANFPLSHDMLLVAATRLGSDIPFFIAGKPAFVTGRGETLFPLELKRGIFLVLVKPAFESNTAEAYRLLDAARPPPRKTLSREALTAALENPPATWPYYNDFQPVFLAEHSPHSAAYRAVFSGLNETGAQFSALSGSGSAVFGVFESATAAAHAAAQLKKRFPFVRQCAALDKLPPFPQTTSRQPT
jgi:4-diphosphocytidyl-2-C-methyl-D-erythritol kinase